MTAGFGEGENAWSVRPAMYGPPDVVDGHTIRWLIVPGPPIACTLVVHYAKDIEPEQVFAYHKHPDTSTIDYVLSGTGKFYAEGKCFEVGPGSVIYEPAGVPHALVQNRGEVLTHLVIQSPGPGYGAATVHVPEHGTLDKFGDVGAFMERFGRGQEVIEKLVAPLYRSARWEKYVLKKK
jgi:uncharacterized RmlC-like cupin family protein